MSGEGYEIESTGNIKFLTLSNKDNEYITSFLIDPSDRLLKITADGDTTLAIYGHSDNFIINISSDTHLYAGKDRFEYNVRNNNRLLFDFNSNTIQLNDTAITGNNISFNTSDITFKMNSISYSDINDNKIIDFDNKNHLLYIYNQNNTIVFYNSQTSDGVYVNTNSDNLMFRHNSASDTPHFIYQYTTGKTKLYSQGTSDYTTTPTGINNDELTLNILGSINMRTDLGKSMFLRIGGLYATKTSGVQYINFIDFPSSDGTLNLTEYSATDKIALFNGYSYIIMLPEKYTTETSILNDRVYISRQVFSGLITKSESALIIHQDNALASGYLNSSISWGLNSDGNILNLNINYNLTFNYSGNTKLYGSVFLNILTI